MSTRIKESFLYKQETPIVYKLWKGLNLDNSTIKENLLVRDPSTENDGVNLNSDADITFTIKDSTAFLNLSSNQSGFLVKIRFKTQHKPPGAQTNADPWVDESDADITLSNAWFGHLFSSAKISLGGTDIELINNFGTVFETLSHLRGYEYRNSFGIMETICPDSGTGDTANTNQGRERRKGRYNYQVGNDATYREFQAFIPLHCIFGFCQDYNRVIRNIKVEIRLHRNANDYNNCLSGAVHTNMDFKLTEIKLQLEQLVPSDEALIAIDEYIQKTDTVDIHFRAKACEFDEGRDQTVIKLNISSYSTPRYFIVACKDPGKRNSIQHNFGKLEHANIGCIKVTMDLQEYPNREQKAKFNQNEFACFYNPFVNVCREFYRNECALSWEDFKDIYTVFAIDTSNQPIKARNETVDVKIEITRNDKTVIPALNIYTIVIYDRWFKMHLKEGKISRLALV